MALEVILPRVDMDMEAGRISRWYASEGETVEKGQPLFEIETDKAAMEIESPGSGILRNVVAAAEASIPVGSVIAWIYGAGETVADTSAASADRQETESPPDRRPEAATAPVDAVIPALDDAVAAAPGGEIAAAPGGTGGLGIAATPLARRLARQSGLALAAITGSGPRRRILARDVRTASEQRSAGLGAFAEAPRPPQSGTSASVAASVIERSTNGLNRVWLRQGQGRPLVLIHGFGADLNGWRPLVSSLASGRPILAIDLPGHGQSPSLAAPSLEGFAAMVTDAMADEAVTEADLAGHSLGAAVATMVADTASFDLRSLLLIAPAGLGPDINGAFLDGFTRARSEASLGPWLRLLVSDEAVLGQGFIRATARVRGDPAITAAQEAVARALFPDGTQAFSIRDCLTRLGPPARVVVGADDRIIPARHALDLPGHVALHWFRGVGHMPHIEVRPALARIIAEHLRD